MCIRDSADTDMDGDIGHLDSPMELFTLRNVINFLLGFSWGGISFYNTIENKLFLVFAACSVGVIFVTLFFYIIQQIKKLEENNTFDFQSVIGKEADVYLRIPEAGKGIGKIQISHKGTLHEIDAVSESAAFATGQKVLILGTLPDQKVLVKMV